jgi:hypothetical protein
MVRVRFNQGWSRRGFALLWEVKSLVNLVDPATVVSLRQFFALSKNWPEYLSAANGDALVVSGLEGCLDILDATDAQRWIETDLRESILSFQDHYEGQAGLIMWLPSGRHRISMKGSTEQYYWKHRGSDADGLPIGRLLFSGAENEVSRLLDSEDGKADYDGKHWIGLHHQRIS